MTQRNRFSEKISGQFKNYRYRFETHWNLSRIKFHKFQNPSRFHITAAGAEDGGGAQLLRQLSAIVFTRSFGFSYVHTPLTNVAHNFNKDPQWAEKWENFLQLSVFNDLSEEKITTFQNVQDLNGLIPELLRNKYSPDDLYYRLRDCYAFSNRNPSAYSLIQEKLRTSYHQNGRSLNLKYDNNKFNVAIHARRGDVSKEKNTQRFTSGKKLKEVVRRIKKCLKNIDYDIYLYSVNFEKDLEQLKTEGVQIVHELNIFDVLDHLIHADLLVTSKSSVSYLSGILSEGIIIHEPFWHPPLHGWLNMDDDFESSLKEKVSEYLSE